MQRILFFSIFCDGLVTLWVKLHQIGLFSIHRPDDRLFVNICVYLRLLNSCDLIHTFCEHIAYSNNSAVDGLQSNR